MISSPIEEIKNRLDIVEVIGSYIKLQKAGQNFRARCPFHSEKKPSFFVSPSRQIWHCFGCFPAKSLIKTEEGFHNIEDIQVGQTVLTHQGRYMPVIRTLWRPYKGDMIEIKTRKSNQAVSLTGDHEVYVIKTKNCIHKGRLSRICQWKCKKTYCPQFYLDYKVEKTSARELKKNDYLLYPINQEIRDFEFINLDKYYNRKVSNYGPAIGKIPTNIKVDKNFLKLIGYYIAEGSNHRAYVRFSLGGYELKFAKEIKKLLKEVFGVEAAFHKRKEERTGIEVSACNSKLANIFGNLCGLHAENKHIPFEFQFLSPEKQRIILEAIWKGDGTTVKVAKCKNDRYYKSISTVSLVLAEQLRDILLRLRITPTFNIIEKRVDKKGIHHKKSFTISWQESHVLNFSQFYQAPKEKTLYWISPIREIKKRDFSGNVYNLTVAKDHSYMTPNFVVGNCGKGGDIFGFVKEIEGVEFGDALRLLAQKAGVELKRQDPKLKTERNRLYEICELACLFFEKQLDESSTGKEAKNYLLARGIKLDSLKKWRVGYAPDVWQGLSDFLTSRGYQKEEIQKAGLGLTSEKGSFFDRFRGRIIFPIFDLNSQVVGFGGRVFKSDDLAKYVNTPNTLLYDKSRVLYGLDKARMEIRKKDFCILVEGYIDVIMCSQAGFENVVATSGTALTPFQLKILKRYSDNLLTAFDMDLAGDSATKRGIDLAQAQGFNIKIITLPEEKDPADVIFENPEEWQKAVESSKSILQFYFDTTFSRISAKDPQGKKDIAKILLPVVKRIPNRIEQSHWIQELARRLDVKEEVIEEELKKVSPGFQESPPEEETFSPSPKTRKEMLEERIASLVLKSPENLGLIDKECLSCFSPQIQRILGGQPTPEDEGFVSYLSLKGELEEEEDIDRQAEIKTCLREIKSLEIRNKLNEIWQNLKKAEEEKNLEETNNLTQEFNQLSNKLLNL
jgi:DNA primase